MVGRLSKKVSKRSSKKVVKRSSKKVSKRSSKGVVKGSYKKKALIGAGVGGGLGLAVYLAMRNKEYLKSLKQKMAAKLTRAKSVKA